MLINILCTDTLVCEGVGGGVAAGHYLRRRSYQPSQFGSTETPRAMTSWLSPRGRSRLHRAPTEKEPPSTPATPNHVFTNCFFCGEHWPAGGVVWKPFYDPTHPVPPWTSILQAANWITPPTRCSIGSHCPLRLISCTTRRSTPGYICVVCVYVYSCMCEEAGDSDFCARQIWQTELRLSLQRAGGILTAPNVSHVLFLCLYVRPSKVYRGGVLPAKALLVRERRLSSLTW